MLKISDFKKIKLEDKKIFDKLYKDYPPDHSDYLFTTLISWMDYGNYKFAYYNDNIILSSKIDKILRLRPPIGKFDIEVFKEVFELAKTIDAKYPFGMINNDTKKFILSYYPKVKFFSHRDFFEYVYFSSDLADLKGSKFSKIRNRLNKFNRQVKYEIENISKKNYNEVKTFLKRWCLWKDCEKDPVLKYEKKAVLFSIDNFYNLGLNGLLIRINDKIEAISVFERLNFDTAVVHYEKGSPYYDGIYKAINKEAANLLKNKFKYINRESDMGIPGLRRAKTSYSPHHMVEVFHIKKDNLP